jgi:adenine C2-methylase RlmN of 23S rRNA A2503 and tRNA A37
VKQILQDLSFTELEALLVQMGEKKFRAKQVYEGLMQGRAVSQISSLIVPKAH